MPKCIRALPVYILLLVFMPGISVPVWAEETIPNEYKVKAAFLYNLARLVEWPESSEKRDSFTLCFVGHDVFGADLESIENKLVRTKSLAFKKEMGRTELAENSRDCHILFISPSENHYVEEIVRSLDKRPILTVGDTDGFAERGCIVNLVKRSGHIRLEINLPLSKEVDLKISSRLLKLAKIIE